MFLLSVFLIFAVSSKALPTFFFWPRASGPSRSCGTEEPSSFLRDLHVQFRFQKRKRDSPSTTMYEIDTWFHIVSSIAQENMVTEDMISNQLGALQSSYAPSNISFNLVSVDFSVNDTWAQGNADADMKNALRQGNYSTLNLYFQTDLSTTSDGSTTQLLGYCTLPSNMTYSPCDGCGLVEYPNSSYTLDGCNVHAGSMPNGPLQYYNEGKTAVHESGHWFGLFHTFQDLTCDTSDPGDYVSDTPQESVSTDGCPAGKDSCPNSEGLDPINNYMDYSTDAWWVYCDNTGRSNY